MKMSEQQVSSEHSNDEVIQKRQIPVLDNDSRFQCTLCSESFAQKCYIKRHIDAVHRNLKPFPCTICDKSFSQKTHLITHIDAIHLKLKPFSCSLCKKSCASKYNLKLHVDRVHNNLRPFSCTMCDKSFSTKFYVEKHINSVHHKLKAFPCTLCNKKFTMKENLGKHLENIHYNRKRFGPCSICGKTFAFKHTLAHHTKICKDTSHKNRFTTCARTHTRKTPTARVAVLSELCSLESHVCKTSAVALSVQCESVGYTDRCVRVEHSYCRPCDGVLEILSPTVLSETKDQYTINIQSSEDETYSDHNVLNPYSFEANKSFDKNRQIQCSVCEAQYDNITEYTHHLNMHLEEPLQHIDDNAPADAPCSQASGIAFYEVTEMSIPNYMPQPGQADTYPVMDLTESILSNVAATITVPTDTVLSYDMIPVPDSQIPDPPMEYHVMENIKMESLEIEERNNEIRSTSKVECYRDIRNYPMPASIRDKIGCSGQSKKSGFTRRKSHAKISIIIGRKCGGRGRSKSAHRGQPRKSASIDWKRDANMVRPALSNGELIILLLCYAIFTPPPKEMQHLVQGLP